MSTQIKGISFHFKMLRQISLKSTAVWSRRKSNSLYPVDHIFHRGQKRSINLQKLRKCLKAYFVIALFKSYFVTNVLLIY